VAVTQPTKGDLGNERREQSWKVEECLWKNLVQAVHCQVNK
jgi:hypothetical protein